jgi:hypothetical protein
MFHPLQLEIVPFECAIPLSRDAAGSQSMAIADK